MSIPVVTKILRFLETRFNRRSVAFLACLMLSAIFWLLTSLSKEYVDEIRIPVTYEHIPDDLLLVNVPTDHISAQVKGFGFNLLWHWLRFESVDIKVVADPNKLPSISKEGARTHFVLTRNKGNGMVNIQSDQLQVLSISPDTLFLRFRPKYLKLVPVKLDAEMDFVKQFGMVEGPVFEPDSVLLIGTREEIDTIQFILTEPQQWTGLNESLTAEVALVRPSEESRIQLSHTKVQVALNVVEFTEGTVKVPIRVTGAGAASVQVFPQEVEIKYKVPLPSYDQALPEQFEVSVGLNDGLEGLTHLQVKLDRYPDIVSQVRIIPSQVEFIIQK